MKIIVIGGQRNGEEIDTLDGVRVWVDIVNAARHVIRPVTWNIEVNGRVTESFRLNLAVHEELTGPEEPMVAQQLLNMLAMAEFARAHGAKLDTPIEPAAPELSAPGPDGKANR